MNRLGRIWTRPTRRCPRDGEVALEQRWDQAQWFVVCDVCGTLEAGVPVADARRRAADHLAGTDGDGGLLAGRGDRPGAD